MAGLYIHIPFCKQACHYCDFHFSTNQSQRAEMCFAMEREVSVQKEYLSGEVLETIYFGGGTPSLLTEKELSGIIEAILLHHKSTDDAEFTLEANPDDCSKDKLRMWAALGINRLSLGVQTFNNDRLKLMNRAHDGLASRVSIENALDSGFNNISVDLIHSLPGQTSEDLRIDLSELVRYSPQHISIYSLTIEHETVFGSWVRQKKFVPLEEDRQVEQLELIMDTLGESGYEQYEISNFCKAGFRSKHNSGYWRQKKYLGIGPGAHSYDGSSRQFNIKNNPRYMASLKVGLIPFEHEVLTRENKINEYLLTSLRTSWGCDLNYLKAMFDFDLLFSGGATLKTYMDNQRLILDSNVLKLTRKGRLLADSIAADLFVDEG